ncbi:MAG TPA: glycosyltransferase family A protein, partial [Bryobacteraceae bacterium]|nr:glycosyltransferase family A protein [Bryobacteraceae bacterium]
MSVVIVCYNQAQYLGEAIESVAAQSDPPMEVILVDDGSTDNTAAVARKYPYVDYVWQANRGLAAARNTGLRVASSEYVLFLDADDLLRPNAVRAGVECFERNPDAGFVFGAFQNIFSDRTIAPTDPPSTIDRDHYLHLLEG